MASVLDLGPVGFEDAGHWSADTRYERRQCVRHNNAYWLAVEAGMGQEPTDTSPYWVLMIRGYENVRTSLTADTVFYLSSSGDDGNAWPDSPTSALRTWDAMQTFLNNIDWRGYKVTVQVSGRYDEKWIVKVPQMTRYNFVLTGTVEGTYIKSIESRSPLWVSNISISYWLHADSCDAGVIPATILAINASDSASGINAYLGKFSANDSSVLQFSGTFTGNFLTARYGGLIDINNSTLEFAEGTTCNAFAYSYRNGSIANNKIRIVGTLIGKKYVMRTGGWIDEPDNLPGSEDGGIDTLGPAAIRGVARGFANVTGTGAMSGGSYGCVSCSKTGVGVYQIVAACSDIPRPEVTVSSAAVTPAVAHVYVSGATITVRTFVNNVAVDCGFWLRYF